MKTYLLDSFDRLKQYGQTLDVKSTLCKPSWWVFNDEGEKECYIFQTDGILIISNAGKVTQGTWNFLPQNESLIISGNGQSYMVHPAFWDNNILALQVDGTKNYAFLIDENQKHFFSPKSYSDVLAYFQEKEKKELDAKTERERRAIAMSFPPPKTGGNAPEPIVPGDNGGDNNRWSEVLHILFVTVVIVLLLIILCDQ